MAWLLMPAAAIPLEPVEEDSETAELADSDVGSVDPAAVINARYAEVYLKIAELNLQTAIESDRRVPNTIPRAEISRLKQIVSLAESQWKAAKSGEKRNLALENDASQVKVTQEALQKAVAANNRAPGTVSQIERDRLRLLAELTRLQLAKDKSASEAKSTTSELQQRVDHLEKELRELREQVTRLTSSSPSRSAKRAK
jgi:chromosome segregation ATPase